MKVTRADFFRAVAVVAVVLAASAKASAPVGRYVIGKGTITDTKTKLTWQQTVPLDRYTWAVAKNYCQAGSDSLAGTGWRLPTITELQTLVDDSRSNPSIDPTVFAATPSAVFLSSTPAADVPYLAWGVDFGYGATSYANMTDALNVRCVR
jgi:hypothetical protein